MNSNLINKLKLQKIIYLKNMMILKIDNYKKKLLLMNLNKIKNKNNKLNKIIKKINKTNCLMIVILKIFYFV